MTAERRQPGAESSLAPRASAGDLRSQDRCCASTRMSLVAPTRRTSAEAATHQRLPGPLVLWRAGHRPHTWPAPRRAACPGCPSCGGPAHPFAVSTAQTGTPSCLRSMHAASAPMERPELRPVEAACLLPVASRTLLGMQDFVGNALHRKAGKQHPFTRGWLRSSNPSIERTFQRPLRALWPAAHVER